MASLKVEALTRQDVEKAAEEMKRVGRVDKWTVIVGGRELPARSLVMKAAGVPPNDSTTTYQVVKILKAMGFEVRYEGAVQ